MSTITGGELLARCLANEGVKFLFGLPSIPQELMLRFVEVYQGPSRSRAESRPSRMPTCMRYS